MLAPYPWNVILGLFVLGLVLEVALFAYSVIHGPLPPQSYQIFRALVATGLALMAGALLGSFEFQGNIGGLTVKAGGPLAVLVFFYWVNPAGLPGPLRALLSVG